MDWNKKAQGGFADKIPEGTGLKLKIKKVKHGGKEGEFVSKKGHPQIMVILGDSAGNEATQMFTLSEDAIWTLAKMLKAIYPSGSIDKLGVYGVEPRHFANPAFAEQMLLNRDLVCDLSYSDKGFADCVWHDWTPNLPQSDIHPMAKALVVSMDSVKAAPVVDANANEQVPF
jgi:hypothetical protein